VASDFEAVNHSQVGSGVGVAQFSKDLVVVASHYQLTDCVPLANLDFAVVASNNY
jgi:hypothetical protein